MFLPCDREMFTLLVLSCLLGTALSANILAVFPHTGQSHFDVFQPLVLTLASRGHQVTVLSFYPQKTPVANYTDLSLVGVAPMFVNALKFEHLVGINPLTDFMAITNMGWETCEDILRSEAVQNLLRTPKKFDLLIVEMFNTDCFLGLVDKFDAPFVGISSSAFFPTHYSRVGSFDHPAYFPNLFFPFSSRMSLLERTVNAVCTVLMRLARIHYYARREQRVVAEVLQKEVLLQDIGHSVSLVLVNSHHSLQGARPLVPGFVEIGGLHIHPAKPLDRDLDKYLNESAEGAILFSMGSVLQSSSFPPAKRQAIMDAFAELPVRVLMKWEDDTLPGKPDNVRLSKWLPQRDILVHPKILAFMAHGGLLSTSEAVYCGVPMVLIPMFGDQPNNVAHLTATGAAVKLAYDDITKEAVLSALRAVLYDPRLVWFPHPTKMLYSQ
uniref:UDP-glucuronosyltransferase n=1 Tax=Graphocephala atropunctata TaxID=36148 RepID=A0A1B6L2Y1_9HEMI